MVHEPMTTGRGRGFRGSRFVRLLPLLLMVLILPACGGTEGATPREDGSVYEGKGTLVTRVNVAIQNGDKLLYIGTVRVIDDKPTVGKALLGISGNDMANLTIDTNADGQIVGVRESLGEQAKAEQEQQDQQAQQEQQEHPGVKWSLSLENQPVAEPYDVEKLVVTDQARLTLYALEDTN